MIIVPVEKKFDWRRPPLALITLVLINILAFAFFQGVDNRVLGEAAKHYKSNDMLNTEWRAYQAYTEGSDLSYQFSKSNKNIIFYIVSDAAFDRFMTDEGVAYIPIHKRTQWRENRKQLEKISSGISVKAYGFDVDKLSMVQLFSSQFLHGDLLHLLGNVIFLMLVGFAVEAALGSGVFLLFYLVSGSAGVLLYAALASDSGNLMGASGSISGVMAMYVMLFGVRKIQFFYWMFVFTGYVRVTAIVMLPVYVIKEIYSYLTFEGFTVAFTAHIGGFLAGAALVFLTKYFNKHYKEVQVMDDEYLDNKENLVDQNALALQRVYDLMGNCQFGEAWEMLKPIKKRNPGRPNIIELEYNLVRAHHPTRTEQYLIHRMDKRGNSINVINAQLKLWTQLDLNQQAKISESKRSELLHSALNCQNLDIAEKIFTSLKSSNGDPISLAVLARQLSTYCRQSNQLAKSEKYEQLEQQLAESQLDGGVM